MVDQQANATETGTASEATSAPASGDASRQQTQTTTPNAEPTRPDYLPETFWDADKKAAKSGDLKTFFEAAATRDQAEAARVAALPKAAGDYKVDLPTDFKMPDGWQVNEQDPMWALGAAYAHKNGLSQDQFSELASTFVEGQVRAAAAQVEQRNAEFTKLGDKGAVRVTALHNFIDASAGTPDAAAAVKASLINSDTVAYLERLQGMLTSAGVTSFARGGEVKADPAKIEGYDKMSFTEKFRNRKTA